MFKINGCLGAWWRATNGILQGCPLSVIVINALITTWKRVIDDLQTPVTVKTKVLPPKPKEPQLPACWWTRRGKGVEQRWVWVCEDPYCCTEMGWLVGGQWHLPPNPDQGGDINPPPRPMPRAPGERTPAAIVWARLGLEEMPLPASTETCKASLRSPARRVEDLEGEDHMSPMRPRVLFEDQSDEGQPLETELEEAEDECAPGVEVRISAEGYADDTYMLALSIVSLTLMLAATSHWVRLTRQEIHVKKSMVFGVGRVTGSSAQPLQAELDGEQLPVQREFRQLGVGVRTTPKRGTGPLLQKRMESTKKALRKARMLPVGFKGRALIVAVMILAAGLYGAELVDVTMKRAMGLAAAVLHMLRGPTRPCRAKEIVFALVVPGHRVAPTMLIPYKRACWLASLARTRGTPQSIAQAVWETDPMPKQTGLMGRPLGELRKLGWLPVQRWWQRTYPGAKKPVNMALDAKEEVEHILQEELRKREPLRVEARRPRVFAGMGGEINRGLTLAYLSHCGVELDTALLRGALTGALWTAARAHERGLRPTRTCPYCDKRVPEDEEHLLRRCLAWTAARESDITEIMLLAKALRIGSLSDWPACLKLCGILPDKLVRESGMGEDARLRKKCLELGRVPRHRCQRPLEDVEDQLREVGQLVEAGVKWAEQDTHPWELFIHVFLWVLKARKQKEDE